MDKARRLSVALVPDLPSQTVVGDVADLKRRSDSGTSSPSGGSYETCPFAGDRAGFSRAGARARLWRPERRAAGRAHRRAERLGRRGGARRARARAALRRRGAARVRERAQGLLDLARRGPGRRSARRSTRRVDRARRRDDCVDDPDGRDVGSRPDRPAQPAALRHVHVHEHRRGRDGVHHRHGDPRQPHAVRRPGRAGSRHRRRRLARGRLPRPRDARRRHGRRLDPRRREGRHARRRPRPQLPGQRLDVGRHRGRRLGDREPRGRSAGGREHEPRRRRVEPRSTRPSGTRSPTA